MAGSKQVEIALLVINALYSVRTIISRQWTALLLADCWPWSILVLYIRLCVAAIFLTASIPILNLNCKAFGFETALRVVAKGG